MFGPKQISIPAVVRRELGRGELIADGAVHAVGIAFTVVAGALLLGFAAYRTTGAEYAALAFYVVSLLTVFSVSCAYNLWPQTPLKLLLRRADHAAIYLLIAGTYMPFISQLPSSWASVALMVFICLATMFGIALKILLPGRFDRTAVAFYLMIGWSGVLAIGPLSSVLPSQAITLMIAGGVVYTTGVIFFAWRSLKYQTAVWHAFVVGGAALHFAAVTDAIVLARLA